MVCHLEWPCLVGHIHHHNVDPLAWLLFLMHGSPCRNRESDMRLLTYVSCFPFISPAMGLSTGATLALLSINVVLLLDSFLRPNTREEDTQSIPLCLADPAKFQRAWIAPVTHENVL